MEKKNDYLFKKIIDWVFRKKTILYFFVMALLREFIALGAGDTIAKLEIDLNLQEWYFHYPIMALNFVFSGGNWNIVYILIGLIVFFRIFEIIEIYITNNKNSKEESKTKGQIIINNGKIKKQVNIEKVENLKI